MHVFAQQNLLDGTGVDRFVPWTKVTKWPNPKEKTYRDLIGDKTTMIDGANGKGGKVPLPRPGDYTITRR